MRDTQTWLLTKFDICYPVGCDCEPIIEELLSELADRGSCSEDDERYTRTCGAMEMIEWLLKQGTLSKEAAHAALRQIWMDRGLEPNEE